MLSKLKKKLSPLSFFSGSETEAKKMMLLSACFFLAICAFSIIKPLKQTLFIDIVGVTYQPWTRFVTLFLLAPVTLFYSRLVDRLRRYQLVSMSMMLYAALTLIFTYFLWHPAYGISNTVSSKYRVLGWMFYAFGDFYQIFIVGAFWAFANSVVDTKSAKNNYGIMVATSKVAGMTSPLLANYALNSLSLSKEVIIPILVGSTAFMLVGASFMILAIKRIIPGQNLHGYEAVYQLEKEKGKEEERTHKKPSFTDNIKKMFEGIRLMIANPYVFGIFGIVYSYEIISAIMDYQMQVLVKSNYNDLVSTTSFMLKYTSAFQALGLIFALFGTRSLLKSLDVKLCLLITPTLTMALMFSMLYSPGLWIVTTVMVVLRALNYGFNVPVREILYIPTVKDIKFKSKAWIDSFGKTLSKASGSAFNLVPVGAGEFARMTAGSVFAIGVSSIWLFIALFVGKKYMETVNKGTAIGSPKESS